MTDVRLTATNPVDSSVVPVSCNAAGELLVAKPVINEIDNDLTVNGSATFDGHIESVDAIISNRSSGSNNCFSAQLNGTSNALIKADGSAIFGTNVDESLGDGVQISSGGKVTVARTGGSAEVFRGKEATSPSPTSQIFADGSAKFSGFGQFGDFDQGSNSGNGVFISVDGQVTAQRPSGSTNYCFRGFSGTTETVSIRANGAATFAGNVSAPNINTFVRVLKERISASESVEEMRNSILHAVEVFNTYS